eukprot:COSAG02_NODE_35112_length_473_cov_1.778075_1_plen_118_part_10
MLRLVPGDAPSFSTGARGVDVLQNYRMDADGVAHVLADRAKKLEAFDRRSPGRGSRRSLRPRGATRPRALLGCSRDANQPNSRSQVRFLVLPPSHNPNSVSGGLTYPTTEVPLTPLEG